MRYLLDTNVISELAKHAPDPKVARWVADQSTIDLSISVLAIGEITKGIEMMAPGRRREELTSWAQHDLPRQFVGRLLLIDEAVAREWGRLAADGKRNGRPLPVIDGQMLATASLHGLTLATRNERDCGSRGVPIANPWSDGKTAGGA